MAVVEKEKKSVNKASNKEKVKIPKQLIYEMRKGKPIYYRDYDKVIKGEKSLEEVMGSSKLQSWIIDLIVFFLHQNIDRKKYKVLYNEIGFKISSNTWRNLDIAIFDKTKLLEEGIDNKYVKTPPEVVIEIDTKADLKKYGDMLNYMKEKTQDLLDAGVKRVIWLTTSDKKVMVAEKGKRWFITDWNDTIEIIEDLQLNIDEILKEEIK
ncbi:MAG: Uma2 family endonuclease [Hydrogenothermaceae bacterium]|nr:Uma2 family endonuclease [Hydrogenothermaceae bacterium]